MTLRQELDTIYEALVVLSGPDSKGRAEPAVFVDDALDTTIAVPSPEAGDDDDKVAVTLRAVLVWGEIDHHWTPEARDDFVGIVNAATAISERAVASVGGKGDPHRARVLTQGVPLSIADIRSIGWLLDHTRTE